MRKRVIWAVVAAAVIAGYLYLLTQCKEKTMMLQDVEAKSGVFVVGHMRTLTAEAVKIDGETLAGLAVAYASGVVVITNGVLEPDPRYKFSQWPDTSDAGKKAAYRKEEGVASRLGAQGKVTFHVVDTDGNSVAGAEIWAGFFGSPAVKGVTDENGLFSSEGKTLNGASVSYNINKTGFYPTRAFYQLGKSGYRCLENGRWIPWNPTLRITLKNIRKPIPMYHKRVSLPVPILSQPVGFDFEVGDWVAPYGNGSFSDMRLTYTGMTGEGTWRRYDFSINFSGPLDGAYLTQKDEYCSFMSEYEARLDSSYLRQFQYAYERTSDKIIQNSKLGEGEIMVFRVRTEADQQGQIVNARYGKIYGPFKFAQGPKKLVEFIYYFNPQPNDRNLEFDGEHNLSDPKWRGSDEPR